MQPTRQPYPEPEILDGKIINFPALLDAYEKPLINYLYAYFGAAAEAEDIAQDAFVKIYITAARYTSRLKFRNYLWRIATNLALNRIRRKKIISFISLDGGSAETAQISDGADAGAWALIADDDRAKRLRTAVSALPHKQKSAVLLHYYEDKSYSEISQILGVSIASVESLLFRARQALKKTIP